MGDYGYYLGPKFSYGIGLKGGAGIGVYLINTGKGYDLGLGVTASFGANFSASASVGSDYIYFPNATSKEHVSGDYESIEASITVKPGIGGSIGVVFYFPKENGKVNYSPSAKGFGIGLSGEVGVGASLPANVTVGKHTGESWWKSFNGPIASAISKVDNKIKQINNLDLILKSSLNYIQNNPNIFKEKK